jgi:alpha-beta hydrolase superfamily lysophospholipase
MNRDVGQTTGGSPRTSHGLDWASISGGFEQTLADDMRMTEVRTEQTHLCRAHERSRAGYAALVFGLLFQCLTPAARAQQPVRHTVTADDGHPLTVWEKRPSAARRSILLLHGRTWPALPDFDLQVPGDPASLMDALVARGFAVYALDARGYGPTPRDSTGWLTPDRAAADAITVCRWVAKTSGVAGPPVLFGWSQGSIVGQLAAQRAPDAMSALVLFGHFTFPTPLPADTMQGGPPRVATTATAAGEDFITPAATDPAIRDAYVRAAVAAQPVRTDWRRMSEFNALDPAAVHVPTLEIMAERDPISNHVPDGEAMFFGRLGTPDREFVVLPGVDHAGLLENQRQRFVEAIVDFVERPRPH